MTRNEAWAIMHGTPDWVERFVALGMLKLEDDRIVPASPTYQAFEAIFEHVPGLDYQDFKSLIDEAGVKIVEKDLC